MPQIFQISLGLTALGFLLALLYMAWDRSLYGLSYRLYRKFYSTSKTDVGPFFDQQAELQAMEITRKAAVARRMLRHLARHEERWPPAYIRNVETAIDLFVELELNAGSFDLESRHRVAAGIDRYRKTLEEWTPLRAKTRPKAWRDYQALILQQGLFASLLRCESPSHVAALRSELQEVRQWVAGVTSGRYYYQGELLQELDQIVEPLELFGRMQDSESRMLVLGQALTRVLKASERPRDLAILIRMQWDWVLETLRLLLVQTIRGIQQKAELLFEVRSRVIATKREAVIVLEVRNTGQGNAQNVEVELLPREGQFFVLERRGAVKSLLRGQVTRLEFLIHPRVSDRVQIDFEIFYDDLERRGNRLAFTDIVEFRQIRNPAAFRPQRPNPYVVGRPLSESDLFFGRDEIFSRLESNLRGGRQDNVVVLMGPRRMGKTSLLRRLPQLLGEAYVPVLLDLQGMIGSGEAAFFQELVEGLHDELEDLGILVEEPPLEELERDPGIAFRRHFLKPVRRALGNRRLLLMFDEFEVLEARIRIGELKPRVLSYFRSLIQHEPEVSFILAGTHRLDQLTRDYWGVLFNLAVYLEVGHLSEAEVRRLFTEPTAEYFDIDPLALDKAWQLTGGHPHFCQLIARELIEYRNQQQLSYLTVQDLNAVADRVIERGELHISYLWEEANPAEQQLLLAVRKLLASKGLATRAAVQQLVGMEEQNTVDIQPALLQLVRKEILVDNAGLLGFRIELLERWLGSRPSEDIRGPGLPGNFL